jgi:hypothetical protein
MHFFLYEIVARIVALYLLIDTIHELRDGLAERKIRYWNPSLVNWRRDIAERDTAPVIYWIQIGFRVIALVACFLLTIFGWWQPGT